MRELQNEISFHLAVSHLTRRHNVRESTAGRCEAFRFTTPELINAALTSPQELGAASELAIQVYMPTLDQEALARSNNSGSMLPSISPTIGCLDQRGNRFVDMMGVGCVGVRF